MAVDCLTLTETVEYDIALHTFTFEDGEDVVVRDCAGAEKFRCDLGGATEICMDIVQSGTTWSLRLGKPDDMPIGSPVFVTTLDLAANNTTIVFEKQTLNNNVIFVGTHDLRYDCVSESSPPPDNGYKRYSYNLAECRIKLSKDGTELSIECQCANNPCTSEGHPGFWAVTALKP